MSAAERTELSRVVRMRAKLVCHEVDAQIAVQLAIVERQLAAQYPDDDPRWEEITTQAGEQVRKADAEIAQICREVGIPDSFRPRLGLNWYDRGENASLKRRAELRTVAQSELEARAKTAKAKVERTEVDLLTKIVQVGLASIEAKDFLAALPTAEQLMPTLLLEELEKKRPLLSVAFEGDE